jgi:pimeloyl-[acyl-carrier protein] methyl ester esterase
MPDTVFYRLRSLLPDFDHVSADYSQAETQDDIFSVVERAAIRLTPAAAGSLQTAGNRRPLLIAGWSLGGMLALRLAAKGRADGLLMFASTARFVRSKDQLDRGLPDAFVRRMLTSVAEDRLAVENKFRRTLFAVGERETGLAVMLPPIGSWSIPALIAGLHVLRNEDYISRLPDIACPALLVHGVEDQVCPYGAAEELIAQMPQARLISIAGCGHAPFLGREAEIAEAIRGWWRERQAEYHSKSIQSQCGGLV